MLIVFKLSMPHNNAWNGKWTGEDKIYARIRKVSKETGLRVLKKKKYSYDFKDGWLAFVKVEWVNHKEAAKIRKKSQGFCGYDWMIQSIINNNKIIAN